MVGRQGGLSQNRTEIIRIGRTADKTRRTTSNGKMGKTIESPKEARTACITFPESEAMLADHTDKGCHRQGKTAEPNTVEGDPQIRNHTRTEFRPREAQHSQKAQAELRRGAGGRDQRRGESVQWSDDRGKGTLCWHRKRAR